MLSSPFPFIFKCRIYQTRNSIRTQSTNKKEKNLHDNTRSQNWKKSFDTIANIPNN